jgi:metal-sulfur cluster biosynthetic enzyme
MRPATSLLPDADAIRAILRQVIDPEVGVNIVDLGLVYRIEVGADEIHIEMTMTSPACPMGDMILDDIDAALDAAIPPEVQLRLDLVWDPPWTPEMMTPEAREHFGWNRS